jgi:hypothetical protein
MHNRLRYPTVVLVLVVGFVLVACGLSPRPEPTPTTATEPTVPPTTSPAPTVEPEQPTSTAVPPTLTSTSTPVPPTATSTATPVPPTATFTPTPVPPTATFTPTPVPPTATFTPQPAPPQAGIQAPDPDSHWVVSNPVHVVVWASSNAGLDKLELRYHYKDESEQTYTKWPADGKQSVTDEVDWPPTRAGIVHFQVYAFDVLGHSGQSEKIRIYIDEPQPSAVGQWGTQAGPESFALRIDSQDGGQLHGSLTVQESGASGELENSTIDGDSVTINAKTVIPGGSPVGYNFRLTLSGDGQTMFGQWTRADMGIPQDITFYRQ